MSAIIIIHMKPKIVNNESNNAVTFQDDENDNTPLSSTSHNNNHDNDKFYLAWSSLFLSLFVNMIVMFNLLISIVNEISP